MHFEEKYVQRYNSEFSIIIPIAIHNNEAFFATPIEMINKIQNIFKANNKINFYSHQLPTTAIDFLITKSLKDELGILLSLRISYVIKNNLKNYYKAFDICNDVKNKGDITYFILMFLDLLEEATEDLYAKLRDLSDKLD